MRRVLMAALAGGLAAGCAAAPVDTTVDAQPAPAPAPADARAVPAGTVLNVRLSQELNTTTTRAGDSFTVTVQEPLVATNGQTVIPEGATITGMVTGVGATDEPTEQAAIRLNFLRINIDEVWHPISANILSTQVPAGARTPDRDLARGAIVGAAAGAVLGAIITGDLRDAIIGAALGAGAGTIISLGMGDVEPVLPEGTLLQLQTLDRIELR